MKLITNINGVKKVINIIKKLKHNHYILHVHINNALPSVRVSGISVAPLLEVTLHRKDRALLHPEQLVHLPRELDFENIPALPPSAYPEWLLRKN